MSMQMKKTAIALLCFGAWLGIVPGAQAAEPAPAWQLNAIAMPTNFPAGATHGGGNGPEYFLIATNVGGAPTSGPIKLEAALPEGVVPQAATGATEEAETPPSCSIEPGRVIRCEASDPLPPGRWLGVRVSVDVEATAAGTLEAPVSVEGGDAEAASATVRTPVSAEPLPFGFLEGSLGFEALLTNADASPTTQAGSHPGQLTVNLGFPVEKIGGLLSPSGHVHEIHTDLPRGLLANPSATPVLCTEAQLSVANGHAEGCPDASQVGTVSDLTIVGGSSYGAAPLFNMVPPPGVPGMLGVDVDGAGIFIHILGRLRSDGDYGLSADTRDILAYPNNPIMAIQAQLWGDPSAHSHDEIRGACGVHGGACPVEEQKTAFLTMPTECAGPISIGAAADSWGALGAFDSRSSHDFAIDGCNALGFEPTIEAKPTTDVADSPSGLDFDLHQPQETDLQGLSTAALRDATVTLPAGMSVNPSQADGLEACSVAQVGLTSQIGQTPLRFDKSPDSCPDAAKLGSLEVTSPLLAQMSEDGTKPRRDPETGKTIPRPLEGSVYLAKPFDNPFGSLVAIYLSINDPQSGTIAKLAGEVIPDPITGQLTTRFTENPQLPLEDVTLHLFGGARGALITPISCGTHTTTSSLTPWSSPEGKDATPSGSFNTTAAPGGGSCPGSEAQAPNSPAFGAGTIAPQAGAYSPFLLKLSRNDGSQRLAKIEATLPKGLAAKFAGVAQCSDAQIAQAQARSHPNEGILEREHPSCPASSQVGTVDVAAGAGPTPFNAKGTAYLAGPYKGAPLSMAIVTPAIAGPFDLGAVVVRTALYVDPETAQGKAVSDPLPTILDGIPLDVRSIAVKLDRPSFTLNPTSCDPMSVIGQATSTLGGAAALTNPFQVGGCSSLPFKPKLSLKLKGGTKRASHPKLIATLKAKPGEANIAAAQVKLPPSAFLDQAHIRTICTRVQFAADACPKGSIYGTASAVTPLLDQPLSGNVYLRSSSHKLPDLVVALKGPASLPIEIDLAGKTDSVKGALRNTFEAVPDAPVTSFHLELFGGKRGLVVNSRDLCRHSYTAEVNLDGQNGKAFDTTPLVGNDCKRSRHAKKVKSKR